MWQSSPKDQRDIGTSDFEHDAKRSVRVSIEFTHIRKEVELSWVATREMAFEFVRNLARTPLSENYR